MSEVKSPFQSLVDHFDDMLDTVVNPETYLGSSQESHQHKECDKH